MKIVINVVSLTLNQGALIREINIVKALGKIDLINQYIIIGQKEKKHFFKKLPNNFKYISTALTRSIFKIGALMMMTLMIRTMMLMKMTKLANFQAMTFKYY